MFYHILHTIQEKQLLIPKKVIINTKNVVCQKANFCCQKTLFHKLLLTDKLLYYTSSLLLTCKQQCLLKTVEKREDIKEQTPAVFKLCFMSPRVWNPRTCHREQGDKQLLNQCFCNLKNFKKFESHQDKQDISGKASSPVCQK